MREARLASSYFAFARRCHDQGAISREKFTDFRGRLIETITDKYALDATEMSDIAKAVDGAGSDEILTASPPLNPRVCERFLGSI